MHCTGVIYKCRQSNAELLIVVHTSITFHACNIYMRTSSIKMHGRIDQISMHDACRISEPGHFSDIYPQRRAR